MKTQEQRLAKGIKASRNPVGTQLVLDAVAKNPGLPSRTIARTLWDDPKNAGVWPSIDAIRTAIRLRRGAVGSRSRKWNVTTAAPSPALCPCRKMECDPNPFRLPTSDETEYVPHYLQTDKQCWCLVMSDIHIPYHSLSAITLLLKEAKRRDVRKIILNGDQLDCHWLSRFVRDPRKRHFMEEVAAARQFMEALREEFPEAEIIWKDGNHDERYYTYLLSNALELFKIREFSFDSVLHLADERIDYVTDKRPIKLGKLWLLHGHEYGEAIVAPVNPARGLYLKTRTVSMCGHLHRSSEHSETSLDGSLITCWSTGTLSELHPAYRPLNKWNHGGAFVELLPDGNFDVENKRIKDGRMY